MPPVNYLVSQPRVVTEAWQAIVEASRVQNRMPLVVKAARYMLEELAYDPMRFGESRGYRAAAKIWERIAFSPPLNVHL